MMLSCLWKWHIQLDTTWNLDFDTTLENKMSGTSFDTKVKREHKYTWNLKKNGIKMSLNILVHMCSLEWKIWYVWWRFGIVLNLMLKCISTFFHLDITTHIVMHLVKLCYVVSKNGCSKRNTKIPPPLHPALLLTRCTLPTGSHSQQLRHIWGQSGALCSLQSFL